MARRRQALRCSARRSTDGRSCQAYAIVGAKVCAAHGGSAPAVRAAAFWRVERQRMQQHVYGEVKRRRETERQLQVDEIVDVAEVLGETVHEVMQGLAASKWLAYQLAPGMRERHERRRAEAQAAAERRSRRFMDQHNERVRRGRQP